MEDLHQTPPSATADPGATTRGVGESPLESLSRRIFLQVAAGSAGALLVGCRSLASGESAISPPPVPASPTPPGNGEFGVWMEIHADNRIRIVTPQSEMGQGVLDSLPRVLADELGADWQSVEVVLPWGDDRFINPITKRHRTANSESTMIYWDLLRQAGAAARESLIAAAAAAWSVPASEIRAEDGRLSHAGSGRSAPFGEFAAAAAALPAPEKPRLKAASELKWVGKSLVRKDTPSKCDGSAHFGIDVRQPGMLYAALRRADAVDGKVASFDRESIATRPGFVDAFAVTDGVAVLARSTWQAFKAAEALQVTVDATRSAGVETEAMRARMLAALDDEENARPGRPIFSKVPYDKSATEKAIAEAPIRRSWIYEVPYLAHAALEPLTATAVVREGECEMWAPTQQPDRTLDVMAQVSGLPRERCRLNVTLIGGGFGRKWEVDFARQAMEIARGVKGRTIHLTWTREQDFLHDRFRPAHIVRTRVGLARDGTILGMHSRTTGINMWKYQGRPPMGNGGDPFALGLLINDKYAIANPYTDHVETQFPIPVGTWRSVSASMNGFFSESALDDVAAVTKQDPLELRLKLLASDARAVDVLRHAAEKARWGEKLPRGRGRGIALSVGFNSYCAQVVEVSVRSNAVKVERIVCAFDCGRMIDPGVVEAQVEGGIVWGLCAARNGRIRFTEGAAVDTNFHQSPLLRMNEMPKIEIHILRTDNRPGGAGEASVPPVAPALAQAIFAATGRRPRRMPIIESGFELA